MFAHGQSFMARHMSGRYLRTDWAPPILQPGGGLLSNAIHALVDDPFDAYSQRSPEFLFGYAVHQRSAWALVSEQFEIVAAPCCSCCGHPPWKPASSGGAYRCEKHRDSNPCAVEGCTRTRAAKGWLANDVFLCSTHWRIACPPLSPMRRALNRIYRLHKRATETDKPALNARWWRLWRGIVSRARGRSFNQLEHSEDLGKDVMRFMGWEEAA
jgi:hypothetical protein